MPIVPVQPTAGRRVGPTAAQAPTVSQDFGTAPTRALTQGAGQLATILQKQAEDRDNAQARNAFNEFRRGARNQINALQTRRGKDAYGVQKDYDDWYAETSGTVSANLENANQQNIFNQLSSSKYESDANTMGAYALTEHFKYVESVYQDTVSSAVAEAANDPFNQEALNQEIENVRASLEAARPGVDNGAEFDRAQASVILAAVQAQISTNPLKASDTIEQYKDELGGAYAKVKDQVDSESLLVEAQHLFPESSDDRYDFIQNKPGISESVRTTALGRENSRQAEVEHRKAEQVRQERLEFSNQFYEALGAGNLVGARALADSMDPVLFTQKEKLGYLKAAQNKTFTTDPIAAKGLQQDIFAGIISTREQLLDDPRLESIKAEGMRSLFNTLEDATNSPEAKAEAQKAGAAIKDIRQKYDRIFTAKSYPDMHVQKAEFNAIYQEEIDSAAADKGRKLTYREVTDIGLDLLRLRVQSRSLFGIDALARDAEFRRIQQILDPEKFPATLKESAPTQAAPSPEAAADITGARGTRGVQRPIPEETPGQVQAAQETKVQETVAPEAPWVARIPGGVQSSIVTSLTEAGRPLYYRDIWKLYSSQFPEEARAIEQSEGL